MKLSRMALIASLMPALMATEHHCAAPEVEPVPPDELPMSFRDNEKIRAAEAKMARRAAKRRSAR